MVTITKMRKVSEILHTMTPSELTEVMGMCRDIKTMKAKSDIKVGMRKQKRRLVLWSKSTRQEHLSIW